MIIGTQVKWVSAMEADWYDIQYRSRSAFTHLPQGSCVYIYCSCYIQDDWQTIHLKKQHHYNGTRSSAFCIICINYTGHCCMTWLWPVWTRVMEALLELSSYHTLTIYIDVYSGLCFNDLNSGRSKYQNPKIYQLFFKIVFSDANKAANKSALRGKTPE